MAEVNGSANDSNTIMKHISLLILFLNVSLLCSANCDSVGFCRVKYNDSIIAEFTEFEPIQIDEKSIATTDSISVFYFKDIQCETCLTDLLIVDGEGNNFKLVDRYHQREWISFSINELREYAATMKSKYFRFYYWERPGRLQDNSLIEPATKKLIFSLLLK